MATLPRPHTPLFKPGSEQHELHGLAKLGVPPRSVASHIVKDSEAIRRTARLQHYSLFSNISPRDIDVIAGAASRCGIARGRTIQTEGEPVRQLVLITLGSAKIVQLSRNRMEVILHICGPGELIDPLGIAKRGVYRSTAKTMQVCEALTWEIETFDSLSRQYPILRLNVALIIDKQLKDMENRFRAISTERAEIRLRTQIVRLVNQVGHRNNGAIEIIISREELAQFTGTTVFNVCRLLSKWSKQGIVRARREAISIYDLQSLAEFPGNGALHLPRLLETLCTK